MSSFGDLKEPSIFTGSVTMLCMHIKWLVVPFLCHHNAISSRQCRKTKTHFAIYKQKCKAAKVSMNLRAIPDDEEGRTLKYGPPFRLFHQPDDPPSQTTLDASLVPKIPQYTRTGLLEHIMELIVSEDEVFLFFLLFSHTEYLCTSQAIRLVDRKPFHRLLLFMCPQTPEHDIPHCSKVTDEIVKRAEEMVALIRLKLKVGTT